MEPSTVFGKKRLISEVWTWTLFAVPRVAQLAQPPTEEGNEQRPTTKGTPDDFPRKAKYAQ